MAKIFKISGYYIDPNDDYDYNDIKISLEQNSDLIYHYIRVRECDLGEWQDDSPLNKTYCPLSECEKYFE